MLLTSPPGWSGGTQPYRCATRAATRSQGDTRVRHSERGGPPLAAKYSIITGRNPAASAASRAASRYSFKSSLVEEINTEHCLAINRNYSVGDWPSGRTARPDRPLTNDPLA